MEPSTTILTVMLIMLLILLGASIFGVIFAFGYLIFNIIKDNKKE